MRYHLTPSGWLLSKKKDKYWWGCGEIGTLAHCRWKCKRYSHYGGFLNILKVEPVIPLLGIYPKELKSGSRQDISTFMFSTALFTMAKKWKQSKCSLTGKSMKKTWYIHTMGHYSASKKKEILQCVTTWVNLEDIMLSEINQSQNDKYCMIPLIWGIYHSQIHRIKEWNGDCQGLEGGEMWRY